jgi:hypothetical protein
MAARRHAGGLVTAALAVALVACGGGDDAAVDGGGDVAIDAATGLPTTCTDACTAIDLTATFGGTNRGFERAYFGLTSPTKSASGEFELYVEASAGGDGLCPSDTSPTPDRIVRVTGLLAPVGVPVPITSATVSLLDFEGSLLPDVPTATATASTVTWIAADVCTECTAGDDRDRFATFDLSATFDGGSAAGRIYAGHCDSLDDL